MADEALILKQEARGDGSLPLAKLSVITRDPRDYGTKTNPGEDREPDRFADTPRCAPRPDAAHSIDCEQEGTIDAETGRLEISDYDTEMLGGFPAEKQGFHQTQSAGKRRTSPEVSGT